SRCGRRTLSELTFQLAIFMRGSARASDGATGYAGCSAGQEAHHPVHEAAVRWLEQVARRPARLPQHGHGLGHRVEAGAAVVLAHAAGTDAAKWQVASGEVQQGVVDGDAAGDDAAEDLLHRRAVAAEG